MLECLRLQWQNEHSIVLGQRTSNDIVQFQKELRFFFFSRFSDEMCTKIFWSSICHLATSVHIYGFYFILLFQRFSLHFLALFWHKIHAHKLKHVVTTCIQLSGISSECGIHNLKAAGALSTRFVVCTVFILFFCTLLTETSDACLPKN